jgi:RimJ/RimL family protein N-acetyltransferase
MSWALESFELVDGDLVVRELRESDLPAVSQAIVDPEGWCGRTWGASDTAGALKFLRERLSSRARGESLPLVYFLGGEVAGVSGIHSVVERRRVLEIGFTGVVPKLRRSSVNTRVKALLLRYSFEKLGAVRVEFRVDARNYTSQMAVLRLGGKFDGRIDHWVVRDGDPHPVGHIYSVTLDRWTEVNARLTALLARGAPTEKFLPFAIPGPRLRLERSRLADAPELLALAQGDPASIRASFPQLARLRNLDDARAYIAQRAHGAAAGTTFHYVARDQSYSAAIGHLQIKNVDWERGTCELGYLLAPEQRGRGYGTELLALALRELRALPRITARVLPENHASLALLRKLGFEEEGVLRGEHRTAAGDRRDVILLARARETRTERPAANPVHASAN